MRECAMLKDTAVCSCLIHSLSWELGVGYMDEIQYCAEELNGWTGGTENCVEGRHHGMSLDIPYVVWGLRDGMDRWDSPYDSLGLREEIDKWDRELC